MKKIFAVILGLSMLSFMAIPLNKVKATAPFDGKMIALDAGHGGTEIGAVNTRYGLQEKDVNLETVYALKIKLETAGAKVVLTREADETIPSRKERVAIAKSKCLALGKECDILVSVHHNGSSNIDADGTMVIYNEKQDKPLAFALHDSLINELGLPDLGYENGGYGITVYGHLVSALTEGYFITNDLEAAQFLSGTRKTQEVQALYDGIGSYFLNKPAKKGR